MMERDLTTGRITATMVRFAVPMIVGDLLQQLYNVVDTLIVGKFVGRDALAAVGSSYTLMTFLTSILLGLCMGSGTVFSMYYGAKNNERLKKSAYTSFIMIAVCAVILSVIVFAFVDPIMAFLQVPGEVYQMMRNYLMIIFTGIAATFLYNFFAFLLRALGNSVVPLAFLAVSAVMNIVLDLVFVLVFDMGVEGAAIATVFSQYVSGVGLAVYTLVKHKELRPGGGIYEKGLLRELADFSFLTCFRHSRYGRVRRRREDRFLRIYARAGFRQRLFHIYRPKLWGGREGKNKKGHSRGFQNIGGIQHSHQRGGLPIRKASYAHIHTAA